jgi:predicted transcriptional regulator
VISARVLDKGVTAKASLARVEALMSDGLKRTPQQIGDVCHIADNTVVKNIKFLRDKGISIKMERINLDNGQYYFKYWVDKTKKIFEEMSPGEKIVVLKNIIKTYPEGHNQVTAILAQIERIEGKNAI